MRAYLLFPFPLSLSLSLFAFSFPPSPSRSRCLFSCSPFEPIDVNYGSYLRVFPSRRVARSDTALNKSDTRLPSPMIAGR